MFPPPRILCCNVLTLFQEIFSRRLDQFYAATSPLLSYYSSSNTPLASLSGKTSDEIWPQLDGLVRSRFPGLKETAEAKEARKRTSLSEAALSRQPPNPSVSSSTTTKI